MTQLSIYPDAQSRVAEPQFQSTDPERIRERLEAIGVEFSRPPLPAVDLDTDANQDEVIEAYRVELDRLMQDYSFAAVDVLCVTQTHPSLDRLRREFVREHWHPSPEGRLFVDGRGVFYLREGGSVYALLCERGDFVCLPPRTSHWFDMGRQPAFRSIRLFTDPEGWAAIHTGRDMDGFFPPLEGQPADLR